MARVHFKKGNLEQFNSIVKDPNTIYFVDGGNSGAGHQIYLGDVPYYTVANFFTNSGKENDMPLHYKKGDIWFLKDSVPELNENGEPIRDSEGNVIMKEVAFIKICKNNYIDKYMDSDWQQLSLNATSAVVQEMIWDTTSANYRAGISNNAVVTGKPGKTSEIIYQDGNQNMILGFKEIFNDIINNTATGDYSHAEGTHTNAAGLAAHAEGKNTTASGYSSHAEGYYTKASGESSHVEGNYAIASGNNSHAEGNHTNALGGSSHTEGNSTTASGNASHAEGNATNALGNYSHTEGYSKNTLPKAITKDSTNEEILDAWETTKFSLAKGDSTHTEGENCLALNKNAHAEGAYTVADGLAAHSEGMETCASGDTSHTEGGGTTASGASSHAEGSGTLASANSSHSEGIDSSASGEASHAEGISTEAIGEYSHAEGNDTIASGSYSHSEGDFTNASSYASHAEGSYTKASSQSSHAEGNRTTASGDNSHAEGIYTNTIGDNSHAEGYSSNTLPKDITKDSSNGDIVSTWDKTKFSLAKGNNSHIEGENCLALNKNAHAEGLSTIAIGETSHTEGHDTIASGVNSHAEGNHTEVFGNNSHAEGWNSKAEGNTSHAEGYETKASGNTSHAEGELTIAQGICSHASGYKTIANGYQFVCGKYNDKRGSASPDGSDGTLFIVGCGTQYVPDNAFRVGANGNCYGNAFETSAGADYAELFEWIDGNSNDEDRRGLFVTLDGEKIRLANADDYIIGIISTTPSVIGDVQSELWHGTYEKDIFGQILTETVTIPEKIDEKTGEIIPEHTETRNIVSADYNPKKEYISRDERKEWAIVGLMGKLVVIDDGTCEVNGYCGPGENGIATRVSEPTNCRVMARLDENHIKVLLK